MLGDMVADAVLELTDVVAMVAPTASIATPPDQFRVDAHRASQSLGSSIGTTPQSSIDGWHMSWDKNADESQGDSESKRPKTDTSQDDMVHVQPI